MTPRRTIIEIAANSVRSAIAAQEGGADRIELCEFLEGGGVTPSFGTISLCRDKLNIPLHVLIRPRVGDFVYSEEEREIMLRDISICQQLACDGVVIGALDRYGNIDRDFCLAMREVAGDMHLVFHRAFDCITKHDENWPVLTELGIQTLLSSGAADTAPQGKENLRKWVQDYPHIHIMAGAGLTPSNVAELIKDTHVAAVHASCRRLLQSNQASESTASTMPMLSPSLRTIAGLAPEYWQSDLELVRAFVAAVRASDASTA